jgi:two-component system, sensor histidine kinase PhcS
MTFKPQPVEKRSFFTEKAPLLSNYAMARFAAENRRATIQNIQMISVIAAILIPLFSVMDYFAYREHFWRFLGFRFACTILVLLVWRISRTPWGRRFYREFTVILPIIPGSFITMMIGYTNDPGSPYYAGLSLVLVGVGFFFHWTYWEALISSILIMFIYLIGCLPTVIQLADNKKIVDLSSNLFFIFATGMVITSGCFAQYRIRIAEFLARENLRKSQSDLATKNDQLIRTMVNLHKTERELIQSEKMASLGQLCAGVIHEIGNPLNFANQALYVMRKKIQKSHYEGLSTIVNDLQDGCDRIKDIVTELRDFSHKGGGQTQTFPIEESINSALRILGREIENSQINVAVEIDQSSRATTLEVLGVKNQITQVIMNLLQNSIQAIFNSDQSEPGQVKITAGLQGGNVQITITDNGPGIPEENVSRLYDPFFTTKEVGKGTGLGLSICYRIIESHGGQIQVDSVAGESTRFTITLPGPAN